MGILADIFVATPADALRYEERLRKQGDMSSFERVEYKRFTPLEFGTLWAILERTAWNVERHMLTTLSATDEGETWLEQFPDALVALLGAIGDANISKLATAWGKTEELTCAGAELEPVIRDLRRLAQSARRSKKGLYLWGSL